MTTATTLFSNNNGNNNSDGNSNNSNSNQIIDSNLNDTSRTNKSINNNNNNSVKCTSPQSPLDVSVNSLIPQLAANVAAYTLPAVTSRRAVTTLVDTNTSIISNKVTESNSISIAESISPSRSVISSSSCRASAPGNVDVGADHIAGSNGLNPAVLSQLYGQRSVSLPLVLFGDSNASRTMQNDEEFNIRFVKLVRKYKCLYDRKIPEYRNRDNQEKAWLNISMETKESGK